MMDLLLMFLGMLGGLVLLPIVIEAGHKYADWSTRRQEGAVKHQTRTNPRSVPRDEPTPAIPQWIKKTA